MTVNKITALAILITLAMVAGSFAVVADSQAMTPQTGNVTVQITYGSSGTASSATTFEIKDQSGNTVLTGTGSHKTFTGINYGQYYVQVNPVFASTGGIIGGSAVQSFSVSSSTLVAGSMTVQVSVSKTNTFSGYLNVSGITSGTANVSLVTSSGFAYQTLSMTSSNSNVSTFFPNAPYYVDVNYSTSFSQAESAVSASGSTVKVQLTGTPEVSGFVNDQSGAAINNVNVVVLNTSSSDSYTVSHFTGGYYSIQSPTFTGKYVFISAPGYNSTQLYQPTPGIHNVILHEVNSSVYYNYSLSSDLHTLSLNISYRIGNNTTIPNYFANSAVGSLYWQIKLDGINSNNFQNYLKNLTQQYTDKTITVAGNFYNKSYTGTAHGTVNAAAGTISGSINATYQNSGISSSLGTSGYSVKIYALGSEGTPGSFNYLYNFTYNNTDLALSSSTATTSTFKSPILVNPVPSNQQVTLTLSKVQSPAMQDSQIALYWTGIQSNNYVLNSTASNTAFIAKQNVPVGLNVSNAYFNPVNGKNDYLNANFTWTVGSNTYYGHNATVTFGAGLTKVSLNATSPSGGYNVSTFHVLTSTLNPNFNYSVTFNGKTLSSGGGSSPVSFSVPQSSLVTYSAYYSSLNISGFNVPLEYNWYMPNYTSTSQNVTYAFDKPFVSVGTQTAYLNVSTVYGTYSNLTMNVNVNDTTPPVPNMKLSDQPHGSVSQPTAGVATVFSANSSTDPYYSSSSLTYKWAVTYSNGTNVKNGSTTYSIVGGSMNGSYVTIVFNTLKPVIVSLNATNPSNISAYNNKTVNMLVDTPRMVVNSIYMGGNLTQGKQTTIYVNVSNNGTESANSFNLAILINNKVVAKQAYNQSIAVGKSANVSFNYTPGTSGKVTLVFQANNTSEPAFMAPLGSFTTSLSVSPPAYKTPLIVGSIIAVIVIVGFVYYRLSSSRPRRQRQPKPKTDLKKQPEKKK